MPSPMIPSPTKPHVLLIAPLVIVLVLLLVLGGGAGVEDMRSAQERWQAPGLLRPPGLRTPPPPPMSRPALTLVRRASSTRRMAVAEAVGVGSGNGHFPHERV